MDPVEESHWSVFKSPVDVHILYRLLDGISTKLDKYYVIDSNSFRLLQFYCDTLYVDFIRAITPHYHVSKRYYVTRPLTYNSFTTIVRHICNANSINITRKPTYTKSVYSVVYFVHTYVCKTPNQDIDPEAYTSLSRRQASSLTLLGSNETKSPGIL
jgi:hypothetical protein